MPPPDPILLQVFSLLDARQEAEALVLLRQLAEREEPGALATLGMMCWTGTIVPRDYAQGFDYYYRAGEAGHAVSAVYATNLLASGYAGRRDWRLAMTRLAREAANDPARAGILAQLDRMALSDEGDARPVFAAERVSEMADVQLFRGVFSHAECDYVLGLQKPDFKRASVIDEASGIERVDPVRTADETHIDWEHEDPLVHVFNRRLAALSGTNVAQGEPLQILRYRPGQQYRNHYDYIPGASNQRILTAILYLADDYQGGETAFPRIGRKVRGGRGDVLLFRSAHADGTRIADAEHAGLPVTEGVKYIATRWIRTRPYSARTLSGD